MSSTTTEEKAIVSMREFAKEAKRLDKIAREKERCGLEQEIKKRQKEREVHWSENYMENIDLTKITGLTELCDLIDLDLGETKRSSRSVELGRRSEGRGSDRGRRPERGQGRESDKSQGHRPDRRHEHDNRRGGSVDRRREDHRSSHRPSEPRSRSQDRAHPRHDRYPHDSHARSSHRISPPGQRSLEPGPGSFLNRPPDDFLRVPWSGERDPSTRGSAPYPHRDTRPPVPMDFEDSYGTQDLSKDPLSDYFEIREEPFIPEDQQWGAQAMHLPATSRSFYPGEELSIPGASMGDPRELQHMNMGPGVGIPEPLPPQGRNIVQYPEPLVSYPVFRTESPQYQHEYDLKFANPLDQPQENQVSGLSFV